MAGLGRDRALAKSQKTLPGFLGGLVMVVIAGILSTGPNFAFAYSQEPTIKARQVLRVREVCSPEHRQASRIGLPSLPTGLPRG